MAALPIPDIGGYDLEAFRAGTRRQPARILNHPNHLSHPNSPSNFDTHRSDNVSRAFAIWSLQQHRENRVEFEAIRRSLMDCLSMMHFWHMFDILNIQVLPLNGFLSADLDFANDPNSVRRLIASDFDQHGNFQAYHPFLEAVRIKPLTIMVAQIDGGWVVIGIHVRHNRAQRPDILNVYQVLDVATIRVWDVSGYHRLQRANLLRQRLQVMFATANIRIPPGVTIDYIREIPNVETYESGLFAHEICVRLLENIDSWAAAERSLHPGPINDIHWRYNDSGDDVMILNNFFGGGCAADRFRSRMLGILMMGASLCNGWTSISACELPGQAGGANDYWPQNMEGTVPANPFNNYQFDEGYADNNHASFM